MSKEALKLALEALERMERFGNTFGYRSWEQNPYEQVCEAITAIKQALAAPVQEPVGWMTQARCFVHLHDLSDALAESRREVAKLKQLNT